MTALRQHSSERIEYRVCSDDPKRGPYEGAWREGEPSSNFLYDARKMKERNERVWIERRRVVVTDLGSEEV